MKKISFQSANITGRFKILSLIKSIFVSEKWVLQNMVWPAELKLCLPAFTAAIHPSGPLSFCCPFSEKWSLSTCSINSSVRPISKEPQNSDGRHRKSDQRLLSSKLSPESYDSMRLKRREGHNRDEPLETKSIYWFIAQSSMEKVLEAHSCLLPPSLFMPHLSECYFSRIPTC